METVETKLNSKQGFSLFESPGVVRMGQNFVGVALFFLGYQQFFFGQFVPLIVPQWPTWIPGHLFFVYLTGTILIVSGVSILSGIQARRVAQCIALLFLLSFLLGYVPANLAAHKTWGQWSAAKKVFSLMGCALVVAGTFPVPDARSLLRLSTKWLDRLVPMGRYPFALVIIDFGLAHFRGPSSIASLVPAWIPYHTFWTYFTGTALIVSGLAIIVRVMERPAATLLGTMIFTWILVLHIPLAIADPYTDVGHEWTSTFEALIKCGVAFILGQLPARHGMETRES